MRTPVAFIIFNRPETTAKVFEVIRQARPSKLLIIADGPRLDKDGEIEQCAKTKAIIDRVDWNCDVITNYSDVNLGCKLRVSSGIDWIFEQVEEAIILEDDCLPEPTFFDYCDELLEKYRYDTRIAAISGTNVQSGRNRTNDSYYFSRYMHVWGWATWRRSWKNYDVKMERWPTIRDSNCLKDILSDDLAVRSWRKVFDSVYDGSVDTWDYQWVLSCWLQNGLIILPNANLISNIGFGVEATHTDDAFDRLANIPTFPIAAPLQHPNFVIRNSQADNYTQKEFFNVNLYRRIKSFTGRRSRKILHKIDGGGFSAIFRGKY
jgi:hypothetical protein